MNPSEQKILVVDDEVDYAEGLARLIGAGFPGLAVSSVNGGRAALARVEEDQPDLVLLDLNMPDMHGLDVLREALHLCPGLSVVVLTAYGTVETAVAALKSGAWDFLTKPVRREDLLRAVGKGCERSRLLGENRRLKAQMLRSSIGRKLVGESAEIRRLKDTICAVAASDYTVLIQGESGTGKELVADMIHSLGNRRDGPFLRVNCPAIPEQLLESELFGHIKGAFTGATTNHKGMFVEAAGGSLMLDEIGHLPLGLQAKLLRVLQDGEVRPVGSAKAARVDTRVIAVTNEDLDTKAKAGLFREDLYYRLNVLTLHTPPLRARTDDIPQLAVQFLVAACDEMGTPAKTLSPAAAALLSRREWPGNVRELQNFIRRMAVFCPGPVVEGAHVHLGEGKPVPETVSLGLEPYKVAKSRLVDAFSSRYFDDLLRQTGGNISEAARLSGIERVSLQKILARLNMHAAAYRA